MHIGTLGVGKSARKLSASALAVYAMGRKPLRTSRKLIYAWLQYVTVKSGPKNFFARFTIWTIGGTLGVGKSPTRLTPQTSSKCFVGARDHIPGPLCEEKFGVLIVAIPYL